MDPSSDRRQARCCDSNLNANLAGNHFNSHTSKPSCCSPCIEYNAPSSTGRFNAASNGTSLGRISFARKRNRSYNAIQRQENIHFARYLSRVLALQSFHFGYRKLDGSKWEQRNKLQHEPKFGEFPLSMVDARALELNIVSTKATCSPSEMTIDSPVVLIFEHNQLSLKVSIGKFPCTRDEWYKYIFWPVHANGGNYPSDSRANTPLPYAQLATAMRAGGTPEYERGSTIFPRTTKITEELGRSLNRLELRKAPSVRLRLRYASLSAQQRGITLKLKPQY